MDRAVILLFLCAGLAFVNGKPRYLNDGAGMYMHVLYMYHGLTSAKLSDVLSFPEHVARYDVFIPEIASMDEGKVA